MTRLPLLPGMRVLDDAFDGWRLVRSDERQTQTARASWRNRPDYSDPATCGALMTWCHRELERMILDTRMPLRPRFNVARVALNEARPWDGESVERAVEAVCKVKR